jgi:Ca-activated chloride channel family protein
VCAYSLIGYENRLLAAEDFNDDTQDAGELGAGHSVTALYEIVPVGVESPAEIRDVDPLRYQTPRTATPAAQSQELAFIELRYKAPDGEMSDLIEHAVKADVATSPSTDFRFAAAVAARHRRASSSSRQPSMRRPSSVSWMVGSGNSVSG